MKPRTHLILLVPAALAISTPPAPACGPFFSESLLDLARAALRPPRPSLEIELEQLTLDIPLPGGLEIPDRIPARGPFEKQQKEVVPGVTQLFHVSGADIVQNRDGCRDRLLDTDSDLARDVSELAIYLQKESAAAAKSARLIEAYRDLRAVMLGRTAPEENELRWFGSRVVSPLNPEKRIELPREWVPKAAVPALRQQILQRQWPAGLPEEWIDYLNGAADFHEGKFEAAVRHFEKILDRPAGERRYRSMLAAYMLGRCALKQGDPGMSNSISHFRRVLELAGEGGFRDPLNLKWDALQCVADYESKFGKWEIGARYYFALARVDHRYARQRLRRMFPQEKFPVISRDPFLQQITTAVMISETTGINYWSSQMGTERQQVWLDALEDAEVRDHGANRLAWLAYSTGEFDTAKRWLNRASRKDPLGLWIEAKLALQSGENTLAEIRLEQARPAWELLSGNEGRAYIPNDFSSQDHEDIRDYRRSQFLGDLGLTRLGSGDFSGSLDAFLRSGHWRDAAYVAEQLLSRDELLVYVRRHWLEAEWDDGNDIRYLTARRLARDRYFKDARPLFPEGLRPVFDHYVKNYRAFRDTGNSDADRAAAGWEAAQIHRKLGIELFGTELAPDWRSLGSGNFLGYPHSRFRLGQSLEIRIDPDPPHYRNPLNDEAKYYKGAWRWQRKRFEDFQQIDPTPDERWRHRHYARLPNVYRWHYRHVAADLAWEAARLMPDGDEKTAEMLCIAGRWLASPTPAPADRFYKALVRRNRTTALGHEADMRRWFPKLPWNYDPWKAAGAGKPEWLESWW